jgi:phosphocarrier protein FPr
MVGLVIVSHSARLAEGVAELARGMAGPDVRLVATGGLDLPDRPIGTDAHLVFQAIEEAYSDDGVLVLMDLGSALLSAEMALDMLPPERRERVRLCPAPLVEGAIAAATQARIGSTLDQVADEARSALVAKTDHFGETTTALPSPLEDSLAIEPEATRRLTVDNRLGLHARPAARFVQTAGRFQSRITVRNASTGRGPVSAKSINSVTTLGVRRGHDIELAAAGPDAQAALDALQALADDNFGDEDGEPIAPRDERATVTQPPSPIIRSSASIQGLPASPGIAIGAARIVRRALPDVPQHTTDDPHADWTRLVKAIEATRAQIKSVRTSIDQRAGQYTAAIFDAHLLFLEDTALFDPARQAIFTERLNAAAAWQRAVERVAADYRALDDEYVRGRAADVVDVGRQVLINLLGNSTGGEPVITRPGIVVAADLSPADTARLDPALVQGICAAFGAPTSHSAILARSLGIPAVVGLGEQLLALGEDTQLIVDGEHGQVWPNPEADVLVDYTQRAGAIRVAQAEARAASARPAITQDGRGIEIVANIGSPVDARAAVASGAEGVGLFRTEFLFLDRRTAPTEDEQYAAYRAAAEAMQGRPVIIRTLDVGGDKPLPYLDLGREENPFLGWRAIRMCLAQPEFFKTQLRAIVRVAVDFPVKVMFPMIATLGEWRAARALLAEACDEVRACGQVAPERIETGIMVEIPAAALRAEQFAPEIDFFSIGTNDLTQYTLAAERGNARVAALADAFHPAVLQLIQHVVEAAHARGKWVGVCGEMGGDPLAVPLLVGLGVDELSMNPPAIPQAKQIIRGLDYARVRALSQAALEKETAEDVKRLMSGD